MNPGFDLKVISKEQYDKYDVWELSDNFYDSVYEYYEKNPNLNVKCYKKGGGCDSESGSKSESENDDEYTVVTL